jgi:hypothetical protein
MHQPKLEIWTHNLTHDLIHNFGGLCNETAIARDVASKSQVQIQKADHDHHERRL